MLAAMEAVRTSKMSISVAANRFNVPRKTLDDRLKGRVQHGTHPGVSTVLTVQEENSLVNYLLHMAQCGFPLTKTMVKAYAWSISDESTEVTESEKEEVCRPRRQRQLPTRYRSDSEDQNDGVLCIICNHNEPEELSSEMVFWIDCNVCGYTPTVLLAPIRSPTNLNVKIVSQIFLSFCFWAFII